MSITLDLSHNHESWVNTEAVTLSNRDGSAPQEIAQAKRRAITTREQMASGGRYLASDVNWHLPARLVTGRPTVGQRIVDGDGEVWTILEVMVASLASRYRCSCRNMAVVLGLLDLVTIQRGTREKQPAGESKLHWVNWREGVRCRIQQASGEISDEHQARHAVLEFDLIFAEPFEIDDRTRIEGPDGAIYKIDRWESPTELGEAFVVHAKRTPWPSR